MLHSDLLFLSGKMKIENVEKLVANLHDKTEYVIYIRNLKQVFNHVLVLVWYVKRRHNEKAKLCYMDTDSFLVYRKTWYL